MKRDPAFIPLSREHQKALILAYRLKHGRSSNPKYPWPSEPAEQRHRATAIFEQDVFFHFEAEEQFLFPHLQPYVKAGETCLAQCWEEHQRIREQLQQIQTYEGNALVAALQQLGSLLEAHVHREERDLFEWAQSAVPTAELQAVALAITTYYQSLSARLDWD